MLNSTRTSGNNNTHSYYCFTDRLLGLSVETYMKPWSTCSKWSKSASLTIILQRNLNPGSSCMKCLSPGLVYSS